MTRVRAWKSPQDIRAAVQRRWKDGSLLRAYAQGEEFPVITVPLGGPTSAELASRWDEWRAWSSDLSHDSRGGAHYDLELKSVGGRGAVGANSVPHRAVISRFDQAWKLLSVGRDVAAFDELLSVTKKRQLEAPWHWVLRRPLEALRLAAEWPQVLAAYEWLDAARGSGRYLRQVDAAGVDTKFVESNRRPLAEMLGVAAAKGKFEQALGLATKPAYVRMRVDPARSPVPGVDEFTLRADQLPEFGFVPDIVLIVENEITFLTVPVPADGAVVWGKGFESQRSQTLAFFAGSGVLYWGDVDTHGFSILHGVRTQLPQAESVLMDEDTLEAHRKLWGSEPAPTNAYLENLTPTERALYDDLVSDRLGRNVRLEQERINWAWALQRLDYRWAQ